MRTLPRGEEQLRSIAAGHPAETDSFLDGRRRLARRPTARSPRSAATKLPTPSRMPCLAPALIPQSLAAPMIAMLGQCRDQHLPQFKALEEGALGQAQKGQARGKKILRRDPE